MLTFMSYVVEAETWTKRVCVFIYVICRGRMKMEEARVYTFLSYVAEAQKWRKRVFVNLCPNVAGARKGMKKRVYVQ